MFFLACVITQSLVLKCIDTQWSKSYQQIFVDDTLFTGNDELCKAFAEEMSKEFEMSMFSEIKFFVGL